MTPVRPDRRHLALLLLLACCAACDSTPADRVAAAPAVDCTLTATPGPGHFAAPVTVTFGGPATMTPIRVVAERTTSRPRPVSSAPRAVSPPTAIPAPLLNPELYLGEGYHIIRLQTGCDPQWYEMRWDVDTHVPEVRISPDDGAYRSAISVTLAVDPGDDTIFWRLYRAEDTPPPFSQWAARTLTIATDGRWRLEAYAVSLAGLASRTVTASWDLQITAPTLVDVRANAAPGSAVGSMPWLTLTFDAPMSTAATYVPDGLQVTDASSAGSVALRAVWLDPYMAVVWPARLLRNGEHISVEAGAFLGMNGAPAITQDTLPVFEVTTTTRATTTIVLRPAGDPAPGTTAPTAVSFTVAGRDFPSMVTVTVLQSLQTVSASIDMPVSVTLVGQTAWVTVQPQPIPQGTSARLDLYGDLLFGDARIDLLTDPPSTIYRPSTMVPDATTAAVHTIADGPLPVWAIAADGPLSLRRAVTTITVTAETDAGVVAVTAAVNWLAPGDGSILLIRPTALPAGRTSAATLTVPAGGVATVNGSPLPISGVWRTPVHSTGSSVTANFHLPNGTRLSTRTKSLVVALSDAGWEVQSATVTVKGTSIVAPPVEPVSYRAPWRTAPGRPGQSLAALRLSNANAWPPDGFPVALAVSMSNHATAAVTQSAEWTISDAIPAAGGLEPFGSGVLVRHANGDVATAGFGAQFDGVSSWPASLTCQAVPPDLPCPTLVLNAPGQYLGGADLVSALQRTDTSSSLAFTGPAELEFGSGADRWLTRRIQVLPATAAPTPLRPADGLTAPTTVTFEWSPGTTDNIDAWAFFVGTTGATPSLVVEARLPVAITSITLPLGTLLPPGSYVWNVGAVNAPFDPLARSDARVPVGALDAGFAVSVTRSLQIP